MKNQNCFVTGTTQKTGRWTNGRMDGRGARIRRPFVPRLIMITYTVWSYQWRTQLSFLRRSSWEQLSFLKLLKDCLIRYTFCDKNSFK